MERTIENHEIIELILLWAEMFESHYQFSNFDFQFDPLHGRQVRDCERRARVREQREERRE